MEERPVHFGMSVIDPTGLALNSMSKRQAEFDVVYEYDFFCSREFSLVLALRYCEFKNGCLIIDA